MKLLKRNTLAFIGLMLMGLMGGAGAQSFGTDTFTGTAGTDIASNASATGGAWVKHPSFSSGSITVTSSPSNQAGSALVGTDSFYYFNASPPSPNYFVQDTATTKTGSPVDGNKVFGVLVHYNAATDQGYWGVYSPSGGWYIYKRNTGTNTVIAGPSAFSLTASTTYTVKLSYNAGVETLYVNGTAILTSNDSTFPAAGFGGISDYTGGGGATSQITYDNWQETGITAPLTADNTGFIYTGKWAQSGTGSAARATTLTSGNQIQATLTATQTCQLNFDTSLCAAGQYADIAYQVDGGGWNRVTLDATGNVACTFPTVSGVSTSTFPSHTLSVVAEGVFDAGTATVNVWGTLAGALKFSGATLDNGGTLLASQVNLNQIEFDGDSITDTAREIGSASYSQTLKAAHIGWPVLTSNYLGLAPVCAGYAGAGLVKESNGSITSGFSGYPLLGSAFGSVYSGVAYSPSVHPVVDVLAIGTNDQGQSVSASAFQSAYQSMLSTVRARDPNALIECLIMPAMTSYTAAVPAAVAALSDSKIKYHDYTSGVVTTADFASDNVHLNLSGNAKLAARLSRDIQSDLSTTGIKYQATPTVIPAVLTRQIPRGR